MKSVLLYSLFVGGSYAVVVSSDRFLIKILDRTISVQDIQYQARNLQGLNCVYGDSMVIQYFEKSFIGQLDKFLKNFPKDEIAIRTYLHEHADLLKKIRHLFKMLRYSEDQKGDVNQNITSLIREGTRENKCGTEILYKDTLKTNFKNLLELELYLRARYGSQIKHQQKFEVIKSSIDLFIESLDNQFGHEYYW